MKSIKKILRPRSDRLQNKDMDREKLIIPEITFSAKAIKEGDPCPIITVGGMRDSLRPRPAPLPKIQAKVILTKEQSERMNAHLKKTMDMAIALMTQPPISEVTKAMIEAEGRRALENFERKLRNGYETAEE